MRLSMKRSIIGLVLCFVTLIAMAGPLTGKWQSKNNFTVRGVQHNTVLTFEFTNDGIYKLVITDNDKIFLENQGKFTLVNEYLVLQAFKPINPDKPSETIKVSITRDNFLLFDSDGSSTLYTKIK